MFSTPKRKKLSSNGESEVAVTPSCEVLKTNCVSDGDKAVEPGRSPSLNEKTVISPGETRRGRPRADLLNTLILEGSTSPSSIKCVYCNRVFPREKSLQAHLRTHTGEKPYGCDYPRCTRKFAQSGQLKTHQRLHTGEKPFICNEVTCSRRFTHANRHCPDHPDATLKRFVVRTEPNIDKSYDEAHSAEIRQWLQNFDRRNKTVPKTNENLDATPKKLVFKLEESVLSSGSSAYFSGSSGNGTEDIENSPKFDVDDLETSVCSVSGGSETEMTVESPQPKVSEPELPKKRWLREATQERLWDSATDLASPINWSEELNGDVAEKPKENENQNRPSVLVCVQGGKSKEISNDEMQGAMALVELKNGPNGNFSYRI